MLRWLKSRKSDKTAENRPEPKLEIQQPKAKQTVSKKELFYLFMSFSLVFAATSKMAHSYNRFLSATAHVNETNLENKNLTEEQIHALFFAPIERAHTCLVGALISSVLSFAALIIAWRKCRNQTWANIIRLRWPHAGPFMVWAAISILFFVSAIILFFYLVLISLEFQFA